MLVQRLHRLHPRLFTGIAAAVLATSLGISAAPRAHADEAQSPGAADQTAATAVQSGLAGRVPHTVG